MHTIIKSIYFERFPIGLDFIIKKTNNETRFWNVCIGMVHAVHLLWREEEKKLNPSLVSMQKSDIVLTWLMSLDLEKFQTIDCIIGIFFY